MHINRPHPDPQRPPAAPPFNWRTYLRIHPAAEDYPLMKDTDPAGFKDLVEDIRVQGLSTPLAMWTDEGGEKYLVDGRNRLDALAKLGLLGLAGQARALLQHPTSSNAESVKKLLTKISRLCAKPSIKIRTSEEKKPKLDQNLLPKALGLDKGKAPVAGSVLIPDAPAAADYSIREDLDLRGTFLDRLPPIEETVTTATDPIRARGPDRG